MTQWSEEAEVKLASEQGIDVPEGCQRKFPFIVGLPKGYDYDADTDERGHVTHVRIFVSPLWDEERRCWK